MRGPRLRHEQPEPDRAGERNDEHFQEGGRRSQRGCDEAGDGCAQCGAQAGDHADETLRQVVASATHGEIGDDQRGEHPERHAAHAVEHLDRAQDERIGGQAEGKRPDRQGGEAQQQQRPATVPLRVTAGPRRQSHDEDLRQNDVRRYDQEGTAPFTMRERPAGDRQDRCIGQLEKEQAARKHQEVPMLPERATREARCLRRARHFGCADRLAEMDVARAYAHEHEQCRQCQDGRGEEDRAIADVVSDQAHQPGGRQAARRLEALVASEPLGEPSMSDEAEAHGSQCGSDEPADYALQHQPEQDGEERRPYRDEERRERKHRGPERDHGSLRLHAVQELAARDLEDDRRHEAATQHQADVAQRPVQVAQEDRHEGSEAGEHGRQQEVDGIEGTQALACGHGDRCIVRSCVGGHRSSSSWPHPAAVRGLRSCGRGFPGAGTERRTR